MGCALGELGPGWSFAARGQRRRIAQAGCSAARTLCTTAAQCAGPQRDLVRACLLRLASPVSDPHPEPTRQVQVHATPAGDGERAAHPTPAGNGTAQATAAPAEPQPGEQAASRAGSLQQQGSGELGVASLELMKRNSGTRSRRLSYLTNDVSPPHSRAVACARRGHAAHAAPRAWPAGDATLASVCVPDFARRCTRPLPHSRTPRASRDAPQAGLAEKLAAEAQLGEQAAALDASAEAEAGMAAADAAAASRPAAAAAAGCDKGTGPRAPPARAVEVVAASMSRVGVEPGYKKTNQDACFVYSSYISEHCSLFGAFDGHGPNGATAAGVADAACVACWRWPPTARIKRFSHPTLCATPGRRPPGVCFCQAPLASGADGGPHQRHSARRRTVARLPGCG